MEVPRQNKHLQNNDALHSTRTPLTFLDGTLQRRMNRRILKKVFRCIAGFGLFYATLTATIASLKPSWNHWISMKLTQMRRTDVKKTLNRIQPMRMQVNKCGLAFLCDCM